MVNKFGDATGGEGFIKGLTLIKKVVVTSGKFKDYYDEIDDSIRLGFNPYYIAPENSPSILFTYNSGVFGLGAPGTEAQQVTNREITANHYLAYWSTAVGDEVIAVQGSAGPTGSPGRLGKKGPPGPAGEIDYSYVEIAVVKCLPTAMLGRELQKILKKSICRFFVSRSREDCVDFYPDSDKVKRWINQSTHTNKKHAVQDNTSFMAICSDDHMVGLYYYLSFTHDTYRIDLPTPKDCCMLLVYQVYGPRRSQNEYYIVGDDTSSKINAYKTIGFSGDHNTLIISNCDGRRGLELSSFPKTNPLESGHWHVLCVEWVTGVKNGSSVWINAKRVAKFTTSRDPGLDNKIILGGHLQHDEMGFHGEMAIFMMFDGILKDMDKYLLQNYYCTLFNTPIDDGESLFKDQGKSSFSPPEKRVRIT